jgi:hypothetical protein
MIVCLKNQARDIILLRRNKRVGNNFLKRHIGQGVLGRHPLLLRLGRKPGQLVAGLLLIGPGKEVSQVTELKALAHFQTIVIIRLKAKAQQLKGSKDTLIEF